MISIIKKLLFNKKMLKTLSPSKKGWAGKALGGREGKNIELNYTRWH